MGAAVQLRSDYSGDDLRRLSRVSREAAQTRRLLALAVICDGGSGTMAARMGGVGLQIVRDWVMRFNARGPEGLLDRKAPLLSLAQRRHSPRPSKPGRSLILMAWCAGGFSTLSNGCGRILVCR